MAGVHRYHVLVHLVQTAVVLFLLIQRSHTPVFGTECDAFEEMVRGVPRSQWHIAVNHMSVLKRCSCRFSSDIQLCSAKTSSTFCADWG